MSMLQFYKLHFKRIYVHNAFFYKRICCLLNLYLERKITLIYVCLVCVNYP